MFLGTERKFGVEVEYASRGVARGTLATLLEQRGVPCRVEGYNHTTRPHWKVTTDVSCGYEVVSPVLQGEDGFRQLKVVLDTMTELGCQVNRNTGVHVHLDASDLEALDVANVVKRYQANEQEIDQWFPRSRRGSANNYCRALDSVVDRRAMEHMELRGEGLAARYAAGVVGTRFAKVNTHATMRHGTIEFRQHAGSTDYEKVSNWVLFLQHFVEQSRKVKQAESVSLTGRRSKSKPFNLLRKTLEQKGFSVSYEGRVRSKRVWTVTKGDMSRSFSTGEMRDFYASEVSDSGVEVDSPKLNPSWLDTLMPTVDQSLMASVPAVVQCFFHNRRAELAA